MALLKTVARTVQSEIAGPDDTPIPVEETVIETVEMTPEEETAFVAMQQQATADFARATAEAAARDLKEARFKATVELLVDKGLITAAEIDQKLGTLPGPK